MGRQGWAALEVTSHYSCSHSPDLSIHLSKDNQIVNYPCIGLEKVISKSHPPLDIFFKKEKINVSLNTSTATVLFAMEQSPTQSSLCFRGSSQPRSICRCYNIL